MTMTHEVISSFLDNEPFDPQALKDALADPAGRDLLIDLLALRHLAQPQVAWQAAEARPARSRSALRVALATAAVFVAIAGGYVVGKQHGATTALQPPAPTHVVNLSGEKWTDVPQGGSR